MTSRQNVERGAIIASRTTGRSDPPGRPVFSGRHAVTPSPVTQPVSPAHPMQQVKVFKSVDTEIPEMERQINRWMRKSGARVLSITGNLSPSPQAGSGTMNSFAASDILVIVLFEIDLPPS